MSNSHKSSVLPIKNRVIPITSCNALFHYDITENCVITGIYPLNNITTLRSYEGKFGGGIAVEEATTNLITNGNFSNGLTGFSISNSASGGTIQNTTFMNRTVCYLNTGIWNQSKYLSAGNTSSLVSGSTYTASFYTYALSPNQLQFDPNGTGWNSGYSITPKVGEWQRHQYTFNASNNGPTQFNFYAVAQANFINLYLTDIQLEQKSFPTSFVNGSRSNGLLYYPDSIIDFAEGTFSCWAKTHTGAVEKVLFFQWDTTGNGPSHFGLKMLANGKITFSYGMTNGTTYNDMTSTSSYNDGQWHHYAITWVDGTSQMNLYVDGVKAASGLGAVTMQNTGGRKNGRIPIGHQGWTYDNTWWNGVIDEIRIDSIARTEDEIASWYLSNSPFYPRGVYTVAY